MCLGVSAMKNNRPLGSTINVAARLLCICLVVAALTAAVFCVTEGPIARGETERKNEAIRHIFTEMERAEEKKEITGDGVRAVFAVYDSDGALLGYCVDFVGNSEYGGDVSMMIGVDRNNDIKGLQVISHSETFIDRYLDENNICTGADVSAGATLSYKAIHGAIEAVQSLHLGGVQ